MISVWLPTPVAAASTVLISHGYGSAADFDAWVPPPVAGHIFERVAGTAQNMTGYLHLADRVSNHTPRAVLPLDAEVEAGRLEVALTGGTFNGSGLLRLTSYGAVLAEISLHTDATGFQVTLHADPATAHREPWTAGESRTNPRARDFVITWAAGQVNYTWTEVGGAVHTVTGRSFLNPGVPSRVEISCGFDSAASGKDLYLDRLLVSADAHQPVAPHPFLLFRRSDFLALENKAVAEPWATMRSHVLGDATALAYDPALTSYSGRCDRLRDVLSANAMAYVLNPAGRAAHRTKIASTLQAGLQDLVATYSPAEGWTHHVPKGCALLMAILALDLVHGELSGADLLTLQTLLESAVNQVGTAAWQPNGESVRALLALYKGDAAAFTTWKTAHDQGLRALFSPDGVFRAGNGYAVGRLANYQRGAKNLCLDVLEAAGHSGYYTDARLVNGHEFLTGYALSPFGRTIPFGDAEDHGILATAFGNAPAVFRLGRFSDKAARYAAWHMTRNGGTLQPRGSLLAYVLTPGPLPAAEAEPAPSRLFDAYAGLIGRTGGTEALYGGLLCLLDDDGHSHKEVNAVALGAYGEHVLRNAGYNGWQTGWGSADWTWINNTAESGNTVLIDGLDHVAKQGAGIREGLTGFGVEYAVAESGAALANGRHERGLLLVQPAGALQGYWLLADTVRADAPGATVQTLLHPNSAVVSEQEAARRYLSQVGPSGPRVYSTNEVKLTTFYATPPLAVSIRQKALASSGDSFEAEYLHASHPTGTAGVARILTVLFPHDLRRPDAAFARVSGPGFTGAAVTQAGTTDLVLVADGDVDCAHDAVTFRGEWLFHRPGGESGITLVRNGSSFRDGGDPPSGFTSDHALTWMRSHRSGHLRTPGGRVTVHHPGIGHLLLDGTPAPLESQAPDAFTFNAPAGSFRVSIILDTDNEDTDALPDAWEYAHLGGLEASAGAAGEDTDGDGRPDVDEFVALTSPSDPLSFFACHLDAGGGTPLLRWQGHGNRVYRIHSNSQPAAAGWVDVSGPIAGAEGGMQVDLDTLPAAGGDRKFIRLSVSLP